MRRDTMSARLRAALGGVLPAPGAVDCEALAVLLDTTAGGVRRGLRDWREGR